MAGSGRIGGGCTVDFKVDHNRLGDGLQKWSAFDGPSKKAGKGKAVTITLPSPITPQEVGKKQVTRRVAGKKQRIRIKW